MKVRPSITDKSGMANKKMHSVPLTISTRTSDGTISIKIGKRPVVTIVKSGRKARVVGRNWEEIPKGTHRGGNRYQFDL